jgi:hypothetical protein
MNMGTPNLEVLGGWGGGAQNRHVQLTAGHKDVKLNEHVPTKPAGTYGGKQACG